MTFPIKKTCLVAGIAFATMSSAGLLARQVPSAKQGADDVRRGYIQAPPGSETLNTAMDPVSLQLFRDKDFRGTEALVLGKGMNVPAGTPQELPGDLADSLTSVRWSLPHGIVVILYEDAKLKGEQFALWGSGQATDLTRWDFNDKASRWAWYDVGGGDASADTEGAMLPPHGTEALATAVPDKTIQMFKDKKFENDMQQVSPVMSVTAGELQKMPPEIKDSLTSLRWNLPPGVIVMLYQDADGKKDRVAFWGKAQLADLDKWDFNDKASRWSWAYIGAP